MLGVEHLALPEAGCTTVRNPQGPTTAIFPKEGEPSSVGRYRGLFGLVDVDRQRLGPNAVPVERKSSDSRFARRYLHPAPVPFDAWGHGRVKQIHSGQGAHRDSPGD